MICPNCGFEQSDGWLSCHNCHIIFSRYYQDQGNVTQAQTKPAPAQEPTEYSTSAFKRLPEIKLKPKSTLLTNMILLIFISFIALVLWWMFTPRGLPVMPGAYSDADNGFAFNPPPEWQPVTEDREIMERFGGVFPPNIRNLLQTQGTVVGFVKIMKPIIFSPSVNVVVSRKASPSLDDQSMAAEAESIRTEMGAFMKDFVQEDLDVIEVDRLRALRIVYSGRVSFDTSAAQSDGTGVRDELRQKLRFQQVFIPSSDGTFILTFSALVGQFADLSEEFGQALDSFRVLSRPARFAPPVLYGTSGVLAIALLFLLSALMKSRG